MTMVPRDISSKIFVSERIILAIKNYELKIMNGDDGLSIIATGV